MTGKLAVIMILLASLAAGIGVYYTQVYAFYDEVPEAQATVQLTPFEADPEVILAENIQAIDADSSPIRYRACFTTPMSHALLSETYTPYENAEPLTAPGWFDCFDADAIGADLESGAMLAFLGERNITFGVDRVVAIAQDGRGFVWHQLNECGEKQYDGSPADPTCPTPEGQD